MMHGNYSSLSDPNKKNFFLPTHHSRKLRHLRGKALKVHKLNGIESVCEPEQIEPLKLHAAEKIVSKDELRYQEAYRGRNIDPFSSVSGTVSFNLFLPPLAGNGTHEGLLCEGVWWDVPKETIHREKMSHHVHLPSDAQSMVDNCLNLDLPTAPSKQHFHHVESSILQGPPRTKLKIEYLSKESVPHRLPLQERSSKVSQFKFETLLKHEGESVNNLSKLTVLPPINTADQVDLRSLNEKEMEEKVENSDEVYFNYDVPKIFQIKKEASDHLSDSYPSFTSELNNQQATNMNIYDPNFDKEIDKTELECHKKETVKGVLHSTDMKSKRKDSGYHRSIHRLCKHLRNAENIKLVDNWIEILETTEFISVPQMHVSDFFGHETMIPGDMSSLMPSSSFKSVAQVPTGISSSIDVMNFFDQPKSAIQRFDRLRTLNRQTYLMKALQCSRDTISSKCKEEVLASHNVKSGDDGALASLLAVHGLSHLIKKPSAQHNTKYLLHKAPKRLMLNQDRMGPSKHQRHKTHIESECNLQADQDHDMVCSQKIAFQSESTLLLPSMPTAVRKSSHGSSVDENVNLATVAEDSAQETARESLLSEKLSSPQSNMTKPKKNVAENVTRMALPNDVNAKPVRQDMRGRILVQLGRKKAHLKDDSKESTTSTEHGGVLNLLLDTQDIDQSVPDKKLRLDRPDNNNAKSPGGRNQPTYTDAALWFLNDSEKPPSERVPGTDEPLGSKEECAAASKHDTYYEKDTIKEQTTTIEYDTPMQYGERLRRGKRRLSKQYNSTRAKVSDAKTLLADPSTNQIQVLPKAAKGERLPKITILAEQNNREKQRAGKFVYSSVKKQKGPTIKGYSTCLIEGGSVMYSHKTVSPVINTQAVGGAAGRFSFLKRKNQKHLKLRGKGESVKKINPLLKYGIPAGKLPTAVLLMTTADLPADRRLHYLTKEKLDAIKEYMKDQYPDIPEEAWEDPEVLVSLLPALINSGCIDIDTLLQFSDEVIIAALGKCDIDALLERPDIMSDPCLYKRIIAEKMAREAGLTGAAKEKLREFIDKNLEIFMDPSGKGLVPVIPPSVAKLMEMVHAAAASSGKKGINETEIMEALSKLEEECGKDGSVVCTEKMVYDHKLKKMIRLDSTTIACNGDHGLDIPCKNCCAKRKKWRKMDLHDKKRRLREEEEAEIIIERREGETSAEFKKREKKERKEVLRRRRLKALKKEEEEIVIERRKGETSAEFKKREKRERREIMKRRRREARYEDEEEIVIERREGETSADFKKREKREKKEIMMRRRREARYEDEEEIVIERREGETSADFKKREKREKREIMRRRRREARYEEEEEIVIERREGEMSADFKKREKREKREIMRRRRREARYEDEEEIVIERREGETSAEFRKREKKFRREIRRRRRELEDEEYDEEMRSRMERKRQRREDRRIKRERGEVVSSTSEDDSSLERWERRTKRRRRRRLGRESDYDDSDDDSERAERRERRRMRREKKKDRRRRREAGEEVSSSSSYDSSTYSSSYYDSSDSYYDSSYDSSRCSDSSYYSDSEASYATKRRRKKKREKQRRRERREKKRREAGIEGSDSDYYDSSSDYSSSLDSAKGLNKEERRQRRKERRERKRREREEDKLLSPESRKRRRKERREEHREERLQKRQERKGYHGMEQSTRAMMKEIGQVMEVVKYVRDAAGNMIATTLKGTRSAIRKLIEENQYFDDPEGEIFTVWDDSIPEIEPFVDSPGYYNEAGEYIEYTPEERQKRREEHMAAVLEREMLIDARQKKLEKLQREEMKRTKSSIARDKERKKAVADSKKKRIHDAAMRKFRKQEERRREKQLYENAIVEEYNEMFNIWRDMDYEYIAIYMGQKYAANLKKAEIAKEEEERAYYEKKVVLLQAQRNELLRRLRHTKQEFFLRAEVELSEIAELLYISRAFVFSYFDNVFGTR